MLCAPYCPVVATPWAAQAQAAWFEAHCLLYIFIRLLTVRHGGLRGGAGGGVSDRLSNDAGLSDAFDPCIEALRRHMDETSERIGRMG